MFSNKTSSPGRRRLPKLFNQKRQHLLWVLLAIGFGQAGVTIASAQLVRFAFDEWISRGRFDLDLITVTAVLGLVLAAVGSGWLRMYERISAERLGQDYVYAVRLRLFDRLGRLSPRALQKRSRGGHLLRFVGDLNALRQWISLGLARLGVALITTVIAIGALAFISIPLAAAVAVVIALAAALTVILGRDLRQVVGESRRRRAYLATNVNEKITSMSVVQVFGQIKRERGKLARQGRDLSAAMVGRARCVGRLRAINEAASAIAVAVVLILGAFEISRGTISAGTVVAAITILGMLVPTLRDLGRVHEYWHGYQVAMERICAFMSMRTQLKEPTGAPALPLVHGQVEFRDVHVNNVLQRFNAGVNAGSTVALVGPNGAGKSTALSLLARLIEAEHGQVLIDGHDIKQHSLDSVREAIGIVSPDLPLMRGSIARNLRYRWRDAPAAEVDRVCRLCGIDRILSELPDGDRTRVVEGGLNFSLGQRQRIMLARALLGTPGILLLDEVDANLDPTSSALLDRILEQYQGTVLLVTHRLDRVQNADMVWHVADGEVVEHGPPSELFERCGPTQRLFDDHARLAA